MSLTDRIAVGQSLMHDPSFRLGRFLLRVVLGAMAMEFTGALLLHLADPEGFLVFAALFHAISASCNSGFSLFSDNLMAWRDHCSVNLLIMALITMGGLGSYVLNEMALLARKVALLRRKGLRRRSHLLTWHTPACSPYWCSRLASCSP